MPAEERGIVTNITNLVEKYLETETQYKGAFQLPYLGGHCWIDHAELILDVSWALSLRRSCVGF